MGITYTPLTAEPTTPTVTGLSSPSGFAGDPVTVNGTNFDVPSCSPIVVRFGTVVAGQIAAPTATAVSVIVPTNTPGSTVDVTVTNSCGETSPVTPADLYTYTIHE